MSAHNDVQQPATFAFTPENMEQVKKIQSKYPAAGRRSAVMPLLDLAQRQEGWVTQAAIETVAEITGTPRMRVWEVATFYTMYKLSPVGKHHVEVCTNVPCWLRGSDEILRALKDELGLEPGDTSDDGMFSVAEAECLGACVNAPMLQIGDHYYEDLTYENTRAMIQAMKRGEAPKPGSQIGRQCSAPQGGPTTLKDMVPQQGAQGGQ